MWKIESGAFAQEKIEVKVTGPDCIEDAEKLYHFIGRNSSVTFNQRLIELVAEDVEKSGRFIPAWIKRRL